MVEREKEGNGESVYNWWCASMASDHSPVRDPSAPAGEKTEDPAPSSALAHSSVNDSSISSSTQQPLPSQSDTGNSPSNSHHDPLVRSDPAATVTKTTTNPSSPSQLDPTSAAHNAPPVPNESASSPPAANSPPQPTNLSGSAPLEQKLSAPIIGPSTDLPSPSTKETEDSGISLVITLLLTTGARHPFKIDSKYLRKRNVNVPDYDPFAMSVYTLKELIWREWRSGMLEIVIEPGTQRLGS